MRLSEQLKADRKKLADMTDNASRIRFIWDYYKIPIIAALCVLIIGVLTVIDSIGRGNVCMYAVLVNNDSYLVECDNEVFIRELEKAGADVKGKRVDVALDYNVGRGADEKADVETLQVLTALFTISDMDLYVANQQYFDYFADNGGYADLSQLIESELLDKVKDDLYYHTDSSGKQSVIGIILHNGSLLHEAGYYHNDVIIGAVAKGYNMDMAVSFIRQLLNDIN